MRREAAAEQRCTGGASSGVTFVTPKRRDQDCVGLTVRHECPTALLNWLPNRAGPFVYLAAESYLVRVDVTRLVKVDGGL